MIMFHSSQGLRKRGINQWIGLFSFYKHESEEAEGLVALSLLLLEPACPAPNVPSPEPPCAQSQKLMRPSPFQSDMFETKCSVLLHPYLQLCFAKYHISAALFLGLGPSMHCLLFTCFKNISTLYLLFSIHYIIVWYIGKPLLLNE